MDTATSSHSPHQRWTLDDIAWDRIDRAAVQDHQALFYLVTSASFIEITSDLYTRNLVNYFADDPDLQTWLQDHWEPEELQHGAALRKYVQHAWPTFDWDGGYRRFFDEYSRVCQEELLGPTQALEMAARCVVETGTATYYTSLGKLSPDPVLSELCQNIKQDEVRHYSYFYHYFMDYREREHPGRLAILRTLVSRLQEIDGEDGLIAMHHVHQTAHPDQHFDKKRYRQLTKQMRSAVSEYFPHQMTVKMLLKPLDLHPRAQRIAVPVLQQVSRRIIR